MKIKVVTFEWIPIAAGSFVCFFIVIVIFVFFFFFMLSSAPITFGNETAVLHDVNKARSFWLIAPG